MPRFKQLIASRLPLPLGRSHPIRNSFLSPSQTCSLVQSARFSSLPLKRRVIYPSIMAPQLDGYFRQWVILSSETLIKNRCRRYSNMCCVLQGWTTWRVHLLNVCFASDLMAHSFHWTMLKLPQVFERLLPYRPSLRMRSAAKMWSKSVLDRIMIPPCNTQAGFSLRTNRCRNSSSRS
jgi:hypothetical protein